MADRLTQHTFLCLGSLFAALLLVTPSSCAQCMAVGDLNSDASPDVVTVNSSSNTISVWINKHNGSTALNTAVNYSVGAGPTSVALADVNADSKVDAIVCNGTAGTISVRLGNGDGTLRSAASYSVLPSGVTGTPSPSSLAVGNLRGNGILDVVVANYGLSSVSVLQGNGQGAFTAAATYAVGTRPDSVALAPFTSSGYLDIATANSGGHNISVLKGSGTGTFGTAVNKAAGFVPYSLIARDFDADGKTDIAVCDNMGLTSGVNLLKGAGDGTFGAAVLFSGGANPISMTSGDFNKDGLPDLATANTGSLDVSVFLNAGGSTFAAPISTAAGVNHIGIATADIDGDGSLELVLSNTPSGISVVPATPPTIRQFTLSPTTVITGEASVGTVVLDRYATEDGITVTLTTDRPDLVTLPGTVVVPAGATSTTVTVNTTIPVTGAARITASTGSVSAYADLTVNPAPVETQKGDLNGDGKLDVLDLSLLARIALGLDPAR